MRSVCVISCLPLGSIVHAGPRHTPSMRANDFSASFCAAMDSRSGPCACAALTKTERITVESTTRSERVANTVNLRGKVKCIKSFARQGDDVRARGGITREQRVAHAELEIAGVEAGRHGAAHERKAA